MIGALRASIRLALALAWTTFLTPIGIAGFVILSFDRARRARFGGWLAHIWGLGVCFVMGVRRIQSGTPPPRGGFAAANHISWLDIAVLDAAYPNNFVAKHEISGWPGIGFLGKLIGTIWVNRERMRDTARLREEFRYYLSRGVTITMFAEGWSGRGDCIRPFRPPLFETPAALGVPCVPVSITYRTPGAGPGHAGPDGGSPHITVCWWDDTPLSKHVFRALAQPRIEARIDFGTPVVGIRDRKQLAAALFEQVDAMFEPVPQPPVEEAEPEQPEAVGP